MTEIAHDAACLRIPVDPAKLFNEDNDDYMTWLELLIERVAATQRQAMRETDAT